MRSGGASLVLRAVLRPTVVLFALVALLGGLGTFAQALLAAPVTPDPDLLASLALAAILATLPLAVPTAVLAGTLAGLRRLRDEGAWLALGTLGVSGGRVARPVVVAAAIGATVWAAATHVGEPLARARLRDLKVEAAVRARPAAGQSVRLGDWVVATVDDRLAFAAGDWVGTAARWRLDPAANAVVATLEDVELRDWRGGARAHVERVVTPFGVSSAGAKVHASERTTPDLLRQLAISGALGRDTYERWLLWKRTLLPACLPPLALAAVPLGLGRRRRGRAPAPVAVLAGLPVLCLWGLVRIADQRLDTLGLAGATALVAAGALAWPAVTWFRWRDR